MDTDSGHTTSLWMRTFAPLSENMTADVCVIGAGMVGVSTAYALAREGQSVILHDREASIWAKIKNPNYSQAEGRF